MMAVGRRKADALLYHSEQGVPYNTEQSQRLLIGNGIACSMSRADNDCDNSTMESFLLTLKTERTVWTNGQVERMHRTIKVATVNRFHYDDRDQLRRHLQDFIDAYNLGRRLKTLKGLTPYELICKQRTSEPDRFIIDPIHQRPGRNIWMMPASRSRSGATTAAPFDLIPRLPTSRRSNCVGPLRCLKVPLPACSTKTGPQITNLMPADSCCDRWTHGKGPVMEAWP